MLSREERLTDLFRRGTEVFKVPPQDEQMIPWNERVVMVASCEDEESAEAALRLLKFVPGSAPWQKKPSR